MKIIDREVENDNTVKNHTDYFDIIVSLLFFHRIKGQKLALQYSLSWLALLIVLLIVTIFPDILTILAHAAGIELPINMVFFLGFVFILLIIYNLTSAISRMSNEIKDLTQRLALLEKKLHDDEQN